MLNQLQGSKALGQEMAVQHYASVWCGFSQEPDLVSLNV